MAGETGEIRRSIAETREEIDQHFQELSGQVRRELNITQRMRRNLPQMLAGAAIAGLTLGVLVGHGDGESREQRHLARKREYL